MITKLNMCIETTDMDDDRVAARLIVGDLVVFAIVKPRDEADDIIDQVQMRLSAALGKLMRDENENENDALCYVVVGYGRGNWPERRLVYSVSGQWADCVSRAKRMTLREAQDFVDKYPSNDVHHIRDLPALLAEGRDDT